MIRLKQPVILNAAGKPMELTPREQYHADWMQRQVNERFQNDLGAEVSITTLTTIIKKVTEQKFFEMHPADYMPIVVGQNAWSSNLTTYRSFNLADDFSTGIINTGANNSRLATADAGVDTLNIIVRNWAKAVGWNIFDLELAAKSGNWDLVTEKERSRKKNWDLGIQQVAFLGLKGDSSVLGLFTQSGSTVNTSLITKPISQMTVTELKTFCATVLDTYRSNCVRSAWPSHFILPESDYLGLASAASADFPIRSTLDLLEETFKVMTKRDFKILPCAYGDKAYNLGFINVGTGKQTYAMLNYDEASLRMDIPVDYTNTLANSLDNFNFQNAAYGQLTGVLAYRPLELMLFQY